jgi:uncharacterized protein YybS (DUF2232 family)
VPTRPLNIRDALVAGLAVVTGAVLAADLPFVGLPLAGAALGWLALRNGPVVSGVAALAATAITIPVLGSAVPAVFIGPALLAVGPGSAWALSRWSAIRVIAVLTVVLIAAALAVDATAAAVQGSTLFAARANEAKLMHDLVIKSGAQSGQADVETVGQLADQLSQAWLMLWPVMYLYISGLAAVLAVPLVSRVGRAVGEPVSVLPPLTDLDMSLHVVWPAIAGLALLAGSAYLRQPTGWMQAAGLNLLLAVRPILFFQGLGDFAALYRKAGVGRLSRAFGFAFLAFSEFAIPSVSIIGLVDIFANLRKLPRGGTGAPAGAAPA